MNIRNDIYTVCQSKPENPFPLISSKITQEHTMKAILIKFLCGADHTNIRLGGGLKFNVFGWVAVKLSQFF